MSALSILVCSQAHPHRVGEEHSQESEEKDGAGEEEEGRGIKTLLQIMEVNKIYFGDEEMRSTRLREEMERFLVFVKLEHFHDSSMS